jgi:hypothetical protein
MVMAAKIKTENKKVKIFSPEDIYINIYPKYIRTWVWGDS